MSNPMDGGSAFPVLTAPDAQGTYRAPIHYGMSLRDYFAGQALVGIVALGYQDYSLAAKKAYEYAWAMLEERERRP